MDYYLYILKCGDGYLYTGITRDLRKRLNEHICGQSKLTKNRGEIKLVHREIFNSRESAAAREKEIKGWRREKKEGLVK